MRMKNKINQVISLESVAKPLVMDVKHVRMVNGVMHGNVILQRDAIRKTLHHVKHLQNGVWLEYKVG